MTMPPLVSIVMSMRNSALTVAEAVQSVQLQVLQDWELILIDDGSTDGSSAIVEQFNDRRIRLVREPSSAGLATRLNQAITFSRGEFIARMDADDVCFPERLALQVERLQLDPSLDLVGCGAVVFSSEGALIGEMPIGLTHQDIVARRFSGFPLPHPTWCGRASWFRRNPYDPRPAYAEDHELLLRTLHTSKFAGLDRVLLAYRQDRLDLRKILPGRASLARSFWRYGLEGGEIWPALRGVAGQFVKGVIDIATVGVGINLPMQRSRLEPVCDLTTVRWRNLQDKLPQARAPQFSE